ncbi:hypothetical protein [Flavobacterium macacae]|uniref:Uncharacterized protein n=1 Tax=Flavobacterium macacae TaxID=2488993 RepID=A0A3P3WF27_9FLAO|nr:hypothetical protein [Flavobacterium macacae]RRJ93722.1 hypothetical protein EG849_02465 [Flavobacterium macacae]
MEPNKLENSFREQLNKREIQPSEMAWDRLDAMLSVTENKKPKKRTWMYVAASFLGFILIGSLFFRQSETEVKTKDAVVIQENKSPAQSEESTIPNQVQEVSSSTISAVQSNQNAVTANQKRSKKVIAKTKMEKLNPEKINPVFVEEAIAQEEKVKPNRYIESESLLAEAETKLQSESIKSAVAKAGMKVNSKKLLSSVEGELDDTFREKVVRSIGKNYETVKSSLATRNQE